MQNQFDPRTTTAALIRPFRSAFRAPPAMRACGPTCCKVYNYMASGVLLTGIVALLFAASGMAAQMSWRRPAAAG